MALNQGRAVIFRCADSRAILRRSHEQSGRRKPTVRSGIYEKTQHHVECSAGTRCVTERTLLRQRRGSAIEQKKSQARINLTLKRAPETHTSGSQSLVSIPSVKEFLNLTLSADPVSTHDANELLPARLLRKLRVVRLGNAQVFLGLRKVGMKT